MAYRIYSGGAGGEHYNQCGPTDNKRSAGGGGGSYNNGSSQSNSAGIRENHGQVILKSRIIMNKSPWIPSCVEMEYSTSTMLLLTK